MRTDFVRRIGLPLIRHSAIWWVAPVLLGIDLFAAFERGLVWRGDLAFAVESLGPSIFLISSFLAGVAAWEIRRDATRFGPVMLAASARGAWHPRLRLLTLALVASLVQASVLATIAVVSLSKARIGQVPIGPTLVQLSAIATLVGLGALIGRSIDHPVAPVIAGVIVLVLTYADDSIGVHLPLGFTNDDATLPLLGFHQSLPAVVSRLLWCAGLIVISLVVVGGWRAHAWRRSAASSMVGAVLVCVGSLGILAHQDVWVPSEQVQASDCSSTTPEICLPEDYAAHLPRVARIVTQVSELLRHSGATELPDRYIGWWPTAPADANTVDFIAGISADEPATAAQIAADVVAPKSCPQWSSPSHGPPDRAFVAETFIVAWLGEQDPQFLQPTRPPQVRRFLALAPSVQKTWVAQAGTDLATCQLDAIPEPP